MRPFTMFLFFILSLIVSFIDPAELRAEFGPENRSINGTGEVLHKGDYEWGLTETDYGLGDNWMIRAPSAAALVGYGKLEVRKKFELEHNERFSPYVYAETARHLGFGGDYGWDFGENRSQSVTLGGRMQFTPRVARTTAGPRSHLHTIFLPNVEYDFYARGNVGYVGIGEYMPYFGHTWAFSHWHIGLIIAPYSGMIPLPYVYLRF